jgi:hypothetical protein
MLETDARSQLLLKYASDYNVVVKGHIDLDQRLKDMARRDVDTQVITLTTLGVANGGAMNPMHGSAV